MIVFGLRASQTVGTALFLAFVMTLITSLFYGVPRRTRYPYGAHHVSELNHGVWMAVA